MFEQLWSFTKNGGILSLFNDISGEIRGFFVFHSVQASLLLTGGFSLPYTAEAK